MLLQAQAHTLAHSLKLTVKWLLSSRQTLNYRRKQSTDDVQVTLALRSKLVFPLVKQHLQCVAVLCVQRIDSGIKRSLARLLGIHLLHANGCAHNSAQGSRQRQQATVCEDAIATEQGLAGAGCEQRSHPWPAS